MFVTSKNNQYFDIYICKSNLLSNFAFYKHRKSLLNVVLLQPDLEFVHFPNEFISLIGLINSLK